jgi:hypothetical protein
MTAAVEHFDVFVTCSFSGKVNYDTGEVDMAYRQYIAGVLQEIRDLGLTVFCAIEHEGWRIGQDPPEVGVNTDLGTIDAADQLLVLLTGEKSEGSSYEAGYAARAGKPVSFMLGPDAGELSYWNQGLVNSGRVKLIASPHELLTR